MVLGIGGLVLLKPGDCGGAPPNSPCTLLVILCAIAEPTNGRLAMTAMRNPCLTMHPRMYSPHLDRAEASRADVKRRKGTGLFCDSCPILGSKGADRVETGRPSARAPALVAPQKEKPRRSGVSLGRTRGVAGSGKPVHRANALLARWFPSSLVALWPRCGHLASLLCCGHPNRTRH